MVNALIGTLGLAVGLSAAPVAAVPSGAPALAPASIVRVGLELRDGAPSADAAPPPATPKAAPAPTRSRPPPPQTAVPAAPPPAAASEAVPRNPLDEVVDEAVRRQKDGVPSGRSVADAATYGAPVSTLAQRVVDEIARNAGLNASQVASVANTPRDQAQFLVERLFDRRFGEAAVRSSFGTAGALAAESYRRMRDIYQVLDLSSEQKQAVVDVTETALIVGNALGQADNPDYEMIDVDPGPRADRGRFERAVADNVAVARCLRPGGGNRFYLLEIPRRGPWLGGARCHEAWETATPAVATRAPASPAAPRTETGDGGSGAPPRGLEPGAGTGRGTGGVEVTPLGPDGRAAGAAPNPPSDSAEWKYIVTDGPQGPVVTRAPAR